jgi:hypothetical protein
MSTYLLKTYPDVEGATRDWLRSLPSISALVATRVFFALPPNTAFPALVVRDVTGAVDASDAPISIPWIQIDCWGETRNKAQASALKNAVVGVIESMQSGTPMGTGAVGLWAKVLSAPWLPDPESDQARYAITAEIAARAV